MTTHAMDSTIAPLVTAPPAPGRDTPAELFESVARLGLSRQFPEVVDLTRELFGACTVTVEPDPEIPNWSDVVFTVEFRGTRREILEKNTQWHRRIPHDTTEANGAFCLLIHTPR
jgi:hypothetical protein